MRRCPAIFVLAIIVAGGFLGPLPVRASQDDPRLDELFARLQLTRDDAEATTLTDEIWTIWRHANIPAVEWMMVESQRYMKAGILDSALGGFSMIVEAAPNFAEGWHKRATVNFLMGNFKDSIRDINKTVTLEPRHFGAYAGLGLIYLKMGREPEALKALERALEINPHLPGTRKTVKKLRAKLLGKKI